VNPRVGQLNNISGGPLVELMIYDKYESAGPSSFRNKSFEKGIFETSFWPNFNNFGMVLPNLRIILYSFVKIQ